MNKPTNTPSIGALTSKLRIAKKLASTDRGAIKLAHEFGENLVCVRHRTDGQARFRYTTVELLVERTEMQPRQSKMVSIRVNPKNYALKAVVRAAGAICDSKTGLWRIQQRVATVLRINHLIV